ncbi:capsid protein [Brucella pseudogrignonensis]|uniref:phage major capsid protein n=1 Tax=Brucella pseudogrignonensis TaxID=419475 RepID=UPI0007DAAE02|nr:phage major capsid protein [Brucella pseudogrignonensis]ANG96776.1 capsid protein [Brucella pseudogrignonensis]
MSNLPEMIQTLGENFKATTGDLATRLGELEKRAARDRDDTGVAIGETIADKMVATEAFKQLQGGRVRGRAHVEMAAITSGNTTVGTGRSASTSLVAADRRPGIVTPAERVLTIRDLIAPGETSSNAIEYVQETGFTNNAAPVAEGAQKPYSDLTFDMKTAPVRVIAHLFKMSKQIMDDAPGLVSYINVRGTSGLKQKEEMQLLFGDGTGQNLHGLIPQATVFDDTLRKAGDTRVDTIRRAIQQVRRAEYRASGIIMNPDDLADLELTKDAGGNYIIVDPIEGGQGRIWRLPIVDTTAMPAGQFLVGALDTAAQLFDRQQVTFEISSENVDDFEKNMATARIEERLALAVYRPESIVTGTFEA